MRRAWLTTEFWLTVISVVVNVAGIVDFPNEAWATVIAWVLGRTVQKGLSRTG